MTELHQIYYKEEQKSKLFPFAIPYYNEGLTIFFENDPIVKLVRATKADKIGVTSWKLADKMRLRVGMRGTLTREVMESEFQVLSLTKNSSRHQMLSMANIWHPYFLKAFNLLWDTLGYKAPGEVKYPIYQNHHVSRTDIYQRYVEEFLSPAMDLVISNEELHGMMMQPSNYGKLSRNADLKSVKQKLGLSEYPLCPFVLERCYSCWLTIHRIPVNFL